MMNLDKHIIKVSEMCSNTTTQSLVTNLSILCPDFDEIFAIKRLKASVAERIQHCVAHSGSKVASLCKQYNPPELQTRLLEEWLSREDWRELKSSFREAFLASHMLSTVPPNDISSTNIMEAGEVNVLSFGEDITMEVADVEVNCHFPTYINALEALEDVLKDSSIKNSASDTDEISCPPNDTLCLPSSEADHKWSGIKKCDSSTLLANVTILLDQCPEVVLQLQKWHQFISVLIAAVQDNPKEGSKILLRYFHLAGARKRGALLLQMLSDISRDVLQPKEQKGVSSRSNFFLTCILRFTEELPDNWLGLLDDEVGVLLFLFLNNAALPHLDFFSQADPSARWVQNWSRRSTFERLVKNQFGGSPGYATLARLQASFPNQYALSLVAYFLPILLPSPCSTDGTTLRDAAHKNSCEKLSTLLSEFINSIVEAPVAPASVQLSYKFAVSSCAHNLPLAKLWDYIQLTVSIIQTLLNDSKENQQVDTESRVCWLLSLAGCLLCSVGDVNLCADAARKQLLRLVSGTKRLDSSAVSAAVSSFWQLVLRKYWRYVVDHIMPVFSIDRSVVSSPVFSIVHLVSISRDLEGWLHIQEYFTQYVDAASCVDGGVLLHHIIGLSSAEGEVCLPSQLDADIFTLIARWSTHPTILDGLIRAAGKCCEHYFGSPPDGDLLGHFFLPPGGIEVSSDFQCAKSPLEQNISNNSDYPRALLYLRVFLFLNLISLDGKGIAHAEFSRATDPPLPFFVETCFNTFLASFATSNNTVCTDDTRLFLLCLVSFAILFSSRTAEDLWHGGSSAHQRMTQLWDVFEQRTGVDPIFLVGRFLISGKGRKRLLPIFLNGFSADLAVDAVQTSQPVAHRRPFSSQSQRLHMKVDTDFVRLAIEKAFSHEPSNILGKDTLVEFVSLWVQACGGVSKVATPDNVVLLLRKRSLTEWLHFLNKQERAACIARAMMTHDTCGTYQRLQSYGVDLLYVSTLCVTRCMSLAGSINKAKCRSRFKNSVKLFVDSGLHRWDEFVTSCLIADINSITQDESDLAQRRWEVPYCSLVPLPSSLFAQLLLRPLTLRHWENLIGT